MTNNLPLIEAEELDVLNVRDCNYLLRQMRAELRHSKAVQEGREKRRQQPVYKSMEAE